MAMLTLICLATALLVIESECHSPTGKILPKFNNENGSDLAGTDYGLSSSDRLKKNGERLQRYFEKITKGVKRCSNQGEQSTSPTTKIGIFGSKMFPVCTDGSNVVIAAGIFGKGRVVISSDWHFVIGSKDEEGLLKLAKNSMMWLAKNDSLEGLKIVTATTGKVQWNVQPSKTGVSVNEMDPKNTDVYYTPAWFWAKEAQIAKLLDFVRNGGGLMVSGRLPKMWFGHETEEYFQHFPINRLLKKIGAVMGSEANPPTVLNSTLDMNLHYAFRRAGRSNSAGCGPLLDTLGKIGGLVLNSETIKDDDFNKIFTLANATYDRLAPSKYLDCKSASETLQKLIAKNSNKLALPPIFQREVAKEAMERQWN